MIVAFTTVYNPYLRRLGHIILYSCEAVRGTVWEGFCGSGGVCSRRGSIQPPIHHLQEPSLRLSPAAQIWQSEDICQGEILELVELVKLWVVVVQQQAPSSSNNVRLRVFKHEALWKAPGILFIINSRKIVSLIKQTPGLIASSCTAGKLMIVAVCPVTQQLLFF